MALDFRFSMRLILLLQRFSSVFFFIISFSLALICVCVCSFFFISGLFEMKIQFEVLLIELKSPKIVQCKTNAIWLVFRLVQIGDISMWSIENLVLPLILGTQFLNRLIRTMNMQVCSSCAHYCRAPLFMFYFFYLFP